MAWNRSTVCQAFLHTEMKGGRWYKLVRGRDSHCGRTLPFRVILQVSLAVLLLFRLTPPLTTPGGLRVLMCHVRVVFSFGGVGGVGGVGWDVNVPCTSYITCCYAVEISGIVATSHVVTLLMVWGLKDLQD